MPIRSKMFLLIVGITVLIYSLAVGYISIRYKNMALDNSKRLARAQVERHASAVSATLNHDIGVARTMAQVMYSLRHKPLHETEPLLDTFLINVLRQNPLYIDVFQQWELNHIDPQYDKPHGRLRISFYNSGEKIVKLREVLDTLKPDQGIYNHVKQHQCEYIIDPYFYTYMSAKQLPSAVPLSTDAVLESTIIIPVLDESKFIGMAGMDIPLSGFRQIVEQIKPFEKSYAFLLAHNGSYAVHPQNKLLEHKITRLDSAFGKKHSILQKIRAGKKFSITDIDPETGKPSYITFAPVVIGKTGQYWSLGLSFPLEVIMRDALRNMFISMIVALLGLVFLSFVIWFISRNITYPLEKTTRLLNRLAKGIISPADKLHFNTGDEVQQMAQSVNTLIDGLNRTVSFARQIGQGQLSAGYTRLSPHDMLGNALIEMQTNLKESDNQIQQQAHELRTKNNELEKLSIVARETDNAVVIMNQNGDIEWINEAFTRIYGYTLNEYVAKFGKNLAQTSQNKKIKDLLKRCTAQKHSVVYLSENITKNKQRKWAQTTLTPIVSENQVVKLVAIDTEVTRLIEAEKEITSQKEEIEQQRDKLSTLNATKDRFFTILAHDLKNPFTALQSIVQTLFSNYEILDSEDITDAIAKINNTTRHISELLLNLLQWARSQTGMIEFAPKEVGLHQMVSDEIAILTDLAAKKQIKLSFSVEKTTRVLADQQMIRTVLRNLVANAIKFTPQGGKVCIQSAQTPSKTLIKVKDTGIGLSPQDQKKLFRIDVKTKSIGRSPEKGTGLGLILCKEFVEKHKGTIGVKSSPGKGSCFWFCLKNK